MWHFRLSHTLRHPSFGIFSWVLHCGNLEFCFRGSLLVSNSWVPWTYHCDLTFTTNDWLVWTSSWPGCEFQQDPLYRQGAKSSSRKEGILLWQHSCQGLLSSLFRCPPPHCLFLLRVSHIHSFMWSCCRTTFSLAKTLLVVLETCIPFLPRNLSTSVLPVSDSWHISHFRNI